MSTLHDIPKGYETKMCILRSLIEIGKKKPLDSITVSELCSKANITRQTFYHHFIDKYDAIQWYNLQLCSDLLNVIGNGLTWYEGGLRMFMKTYDEREFYQFAMDSSKDPNSLFSSLSKSIYEGWKKTLINLPDFDYTERLDYQLSAWARLGFLLVNDWIQEGCKVPAEQIHDLIFSCIPVELKTLTDNYVLEKRKLLEKS